MFMNLLACKATAVVRDAYDCVRRVYVMEGFV
jgi:hypothetical protein